MTSYTPPADDIHFLLHHVIDTQRVLSLPGYGHVDLETLDQVVEAAGALTADVIAPINEAADREGAVLANGRVTLPPGFVDAYAAFRDGGWQGLSMPEAHGGQQLPELAQTALSEMTAGASLAFGMVGTPTRAAVRVLDAHATPADRATFIEKLVTGEWSGTIVMTEAHAGSDIGLARTKAVDRGDGTYAISGTKIFISFADHDAVEQIVHIVLARLEGSPDGVRGLSLFLVPNRLVNADGSLGPRNGVQVARIENKMGIHGSPTCELVFDEAVGTLLGEPNRGINCMFTMINTMRLEVAAYGVGIAGAATANALAYAAERVQGRGLGNGRDSATIVEHPDVRRMLMSMKAQTDGCRALTYEIALQLDLGREGEDDAVRAAALAQVALLLPIAKAHFTDTMLEVANLGVQVFGGHGYVTENGAELYVRDGRITSIYEGTNGIQAVDLLTRKLPADGGAAYRALVERIESDLAVLAGNAESAEIHQAVSEGLAMIQDAAYRLQEMSAAAMSDALAGASPFLTLMGRVLVGWMHLRLASADGDTPLHHEKRVLARFYAEHVMADIPALAHRALAGGATLYAIESEQLVRV